MDQFLDDIEVSPEVDKEEIWDHIIYEYGEMEVLIPNSSLFHKAVQNFFKHWNPIITELGKTRRYEYEPLRDFFDQHTLDSTKQQDTTYGSTEIGKTTYEDTVNAGTEGTENICKKSNEDVTDNIETDRTLDTSNNSNKTENTNSTETSNEYISTSSTDKTTNSKTTSSNETSANTETTEDNGTRTTNTSGKENVRVAAFNQTAQDESEENWGLIGNYDGRDLTYNRNNTTENTTDNKTVTDNGTKETTEEVTENNTKETLTGQQTDAMKNLGQVVTEELIETGKETENETENRTTETTASSDEDRTYTENRASKDNSTTDTTKNRNDVTADSTATKQTFLETGTKRTTYQELIEKQRRVVQFDLCRWILKKWSAELMIGVW